MNPSGPVASAVPRTRRVPGLPRTRRHNDNKDPLWGGCPQGGRRCQQPCGSISEKHRARVPGRLRPLLHPEARVAWTRGPCSGFRDACMSPGVSKGIASCRRGRRVSGVLAAGLMGLVRSRPWEDLGFSLESWESVQEDETRGMGRRWGSVGSPGGGSPLARGLGFCGSIQDPGAVARLGGHR